MPDLAHRLWTERTLGFVLFKDSKEMMSSFVTEKTKP